MMLLDGVVETKSRWDLEQEPENIAAEEDRFDQTPDPSSGMPSTAAGPPSATR